MKTRTALTYDDIQLIPRYSSIGSRSEIDISTRLGASGPVFELPIIATPMDTVCEEKMAIAIGKLGGVGCIHRFMSIEEQAEQVKNVRLTFSLLSDYSDRHVMAAIGTGEDTEKRVDQLIIAGADILLIDVAHGHHRNVYDTLQLLKALGVMDMVHVIAGSIATDQAARDLLEWGAHSVRVGIGNGSLCTTRIQTGHGVPTITSLMDVVSVADEYGAGVITDGGIRSSGDIAKALAVGADAVMLGSLLAGTQESPGRIVENRDGSLWKRYRGSASLETKVTHNMTERNVEGESTLVPFKGRVKYTVEKLKDGLQSALSYSGVRSIGEFQAKARWNVVTNAGITEAKPHLL